MDVNEMRDRISLELSTIANNIMSIVDRVCVINDTPRTLTGNRDECVQIRQLLSLNCKEIKSTYKLMGCLRAIVGTTEEEPQVDSAEVVRQERIHALRTELLMLEEG